MSFCKINNFTLFFFKNTKHSKNCLSQQITNVTRRGELHYFRLNKWASFFYCYGMCTKVLVHFTVGDVACSLWPRFSCPLVDGSGTGRNRYDFIFLEAKPVAHFCFFVEKSSIVFKQLIISIDCEIYNHCVLISFFVLRFCVLF